MVECDMIKIGRKMEVDDLEKVLVSAAEDLGWKTEVEIENVREYNLGNSAPTETPRFTNISLSGRFLPGLYIKINHLNIYKGEFMVTRGFPVTFIGEDDFRKYLSTVHKKIAEYD